MFIYLKTKKVWILSLKLFLAIIVLLLIIEFDAREKIRLSYEILYDRWKTDYQISCLHCNQHKE